MKNTFVVLFILGLLSSCATIFGGNTYNAQISVPGHPKARIAYNGMEIGTGGALISIPRREANNVNFKITEQGQLDQEFVFTTRTFRGFALAGSILAFNYYFVPIGLIVDGANGAFWKPDKRVPGITKLDYDNYKYILRYNSVSNGTETIDKQPIVKEKIVIKNDEFTTQQNKLRDLKKMRDEEIIDEDEYKIMRRKILGVTDEDLAIQKELNKITKSENPILKDSIIENTLDPEEITPIENKIEISDQQKIDTEKINDLNKMLDLGLISEDEYNEMKKKLIDNN